MRHKRPYAHTAKPSARWQQAAVRPVLTTRDAQWRGAVSSLGAHSAAALMSTRRPLLVPFTVITSKYPLP